MCWVLCQFLLLDFSPGLSLGSFVPAVALFSHHRCCSVARSCVHSFCCGLDCESCPNCSVVSRSSLFVFGISLAFWGSFMRFCLYPLAKHQASRSLKNSSVFRSQISSDINQFSTSASVQRKLLLLFVAYHPSRLEVEKLLACLSELSSEVGYAVVVNDYNPGELDLCLRRPIASCKS